MVAMVADDVRRAFAAHCGRFMTEERREFVVEQILAIAAKTHA